MTSKERCRLLIAACTSKARTLRKSCGSGHVGQIDREAELADLEGDAGQQAAGDRIAPATASMIAAGKLRALAVRDVGIKLE